MRGVELRRRLRAAPPPLARQTESRLADVRDHDEEPHNARRRPDHRGAARSPPSAPGRAGARRARPCARDSGRASPSAAAPSSSTGERAAGDRRRGGGRASRLIQHSTLERYLRSRTL